MNAQSAEDILEQEKESLYDYIIRMTGRGDRALETQGEIAQSLESAALPGEGSVRSQIYAMARSFNADIWNATTRDLQNRALSIQSGERRIPHQTEEERLRALQSQLEDVIRQLQPWEREPLLLHCRYGFGFEDVGRILLLSTPSARASYHTAIEAVQTGRQNLGTLIGGAWENAIRDLPNHPLPLVSSHKTQDLSVMIRDLRKTRTPEFSFRWWWLVLGIVAAAVLFFWLLS